MNLGPLLEGRGSTPKWNRARLATLSAFITKGSTPTTYGYKWEATGVLFLRSECVADHGLDLTQSTFISEEAHAAFHRSHVQPNDLLVTITGNVGRVVLFEGADRANLNQHIARVRISAPNADPQFVYYWLSQPSIRRYFSGITTGQAYPQISLQQVRNAEIPLPPLDEQHAIAAALSDVDALLGGLDRLIAKKRDLKQAAMQQLLTGQSRLPGFAPTNSRLTKTSVGVFPADWNLVRLAELVDPVRSIRYGIVQPGAYDPQGRYMIRGQDYSEVKGWATPSEVFRVSAAIEERYRNARVKTGDLIITIVGYCGHVEIVPEWLDGANLTQTTARIAIRPDVAVNVYCKYVLLSPTGRIQVASYTKGAAQPGLNCGDVEQFLLPLPSVPEQSAIAGILSDMDAELSALEARREKTRALKQGMMQELLTGRTRLV